MEDVIAEYVGDKLVITIEGADVATTNAKVQILKGDADDKVKILLKNIVPYTPTFTIDNVDFAVATRAYVSTLNGVKSDDAAGYKVEVEGVVDGEVLTVAIKLTEIEGENVNTSNLYKLVYKGDLDLLTDAPEPIKQQQRVYVTKARSTNTAQRDTSMVKLSIKNLSLSGVFMGDVVLDTVLVQKRGDVLAFQAADRMLDFADFGEVATHVQGTIIGSKMTLHLAIDDPKLQLVAGFEGEPVTESTTVKMEEIQVMGAAIVGTQMAAAALTLQVWADTEASQLRLTPNYKISEKATVDSVVLIRKEQPNVKLSQEQINGTAPIDFSLLTNGTNDYIRYFLAAEDPNTKATFTIYVERFPILNTRFTFDSWSDGEPEGWATSNRLAAMFPLLGINVPTSVVQVATERAALITTSKTVSEIQPNGLIQGVTAGNLFLGTYSLDISNILKSTQFGLPFKTKPMTLKVTYKYIPGATYYRTTTNESGEHGAEVVPGMTDNCSIGAYLYEVGDYSETLDGTNLSTSQKVILKATVVDGATDRAYKEQTRSFVPTGNGDFDVTKKYKLVIACTSSVRGDEYMGADGSQLFIQKIEIE